MTAVQSNPVLERHIPMLEGWYLEYRSCQFDKAQVGPQSRLQHRAILHPASWKRSACIACECYLALHTPAKAVRCFDFLALPAGLLWGSGRGPQPGGGPAPSWSRRACSAPAAHHPCYCRHETAPQTSAAHRLCRSAAQGHKQVCCHSLLQTCANYRQVSSIACTLSPLRFLMGLEGSCARCSMCHGASLYCVSIV